MLQRSPGRNGLDLSGGVGGRFEQHKAQGEQFTPTRNHGSLLPPFGINGASHLPTPQSPGTYGEYSSSYAYDPESPAPNGLQSSRAAPHQVYETFGASQMSGEVLSSGSFITPESSPLMPRRVLSPAPAPIPGPSFSPHTPRVHSPPRSVASTAPTLADPHTITPPSLSNSREITPSSRLSSPFMERLSLTDRPSSKNRAHRTRRSPSSDRLPPVPVDIDDIFSPEVSRSKTPPPLTAPVPQRAVGGEMQRIRLQIAADQAALLHEAEARRPDYLVREKRPQSTAEIAGADAVDSEDRENMQPGLGVTVSPNKGRRLKLFQETSEETFEQSLLAGGYPGYGSPITDEPHTPMARGHSLSQRAVQWLQQATPGKPGPSSIPSEPEPDWVPSEKEIRKRKRLAAFQEDGRTHKPPSKLHPVEIEGKGRVIIDVPPEDIVSDVQDSPAKRRATRRKKRGGAGSTVARKKGHAAELEDDPMEIPRPNWVDNAFPWCMRAQERVDTMRMEQEEKLRWIERFLDRDSDEEDEHEDQTLEPAVRLVDEDVPPPRGRGKWVPLRADPDTAATIASRKLLIPNDPADARAALLSKRSVRALAHRHRRGRRGNETVCICHGTDDGRELVQCDECKTWYHLDCIGIDSVSELGEEEDPWYCAECLGVPLPSSDPASEPTFVPTDDRPLTDDFRDPPFFQGGLQESPAGPWGAQRTPRTPTQARGYSQTFASRSSWGDSSRPGPSTPVSTAQNARVYHTPGLLDPYSHHTLAESPFDPTTTPSRGLKFAPGSTPKTSLWSARGGPGREFWRIGDSGGFPSLGDSGSLQLSSYRNIYSHDDTPVRRSEPREKPKALMGRKLWDSPVPTIPSLQGDLQASPIHAEVRAHRNTNAPQMADKQVS